MSKMSSYLQLTPHGIYYFRIAIPKPLRLYFGRRELKKTLRTSNSKKAIYHAMTLSLEANTLFEKAYYMAKKGKGKKKGDQTINHAAYTIDKNFIRLEIDSDKDIDKEIEALEKAQPLIEEHIKSFGLTHAQTAVTAPSASQKEAILLSELIEKFCRQNKTKNAWTPKTEDDYLATFSVPASIATVLPLYFLKNLTILARTFSNEQDLTITPASSKIVIT